MNQGVQIRPFAQVILLTALLFLSDSSLSQSRTGEYTIETIPYTGQLSGFTGTCFLQDRDGFMWFGSTSGIYRYDGKNFKVFRNDPNNENSLSSWESLPGRMSNYPESCYSRPVYLKFRKVTSPSPAANRAIR